MKTTNQILDYILEYYQLVLADPCGYAPDPCALESMLIALEGVRLFAMSDAPTPIRNADNPYFRFLESEDFGVATFSYRHYPKPTLSQEDRAVFAALATFWQRYLTSSFAPSASGESSNRVSTDDGAWAQYPAEHEENGT